MDNITIPKRLLQELFEMYKCLCEMQTERFLTDTENGGCDHCSLYFECRRNGVYEKVSDILKKS